MEILQVDLEDVKSYKRESVHFTPGTNAICGPNGAGKSTILEAIGFAIFDALETTQDAFVREGENTASVTVHVAGVDGRPFQVVRKCGSYGRYYVYDAEIDQKLTDGKADTMGWLRQFTGVERTGDLSALFRNAVGVPQGLFTAAFLETAGLRKKIFDPLLRVDEYEEVWEGLREPARSLKDDIQAKRNQISRLEGEVKALPAKEEKAAKLRVTIAEEEEARKDAQDELDDVTQRKEEMGKIKQKLDDLQRAVTEAKGDVGRLQARWEDAKEARTNAEEAQAVATETEEGHDAYQAAEDQLQTLEALREERDQLEAARQTADKALALARQQIEGLEEELEEIAEAEGTMEGLRPEVETQQAVEQQLEEARREADRLGDKRQTLEKRREQLSRLREQLTSVERELEELSEVEEAIEGLKEEREQLQNARDALTSDTVRCKSDLAQVREQTETLRSAAEATCPVCEGPLTPEHRAELLARNEAREEELVEKLDGLGSQQEDLEATHRDLEARLEEKRARLRELPRPTEAEKLSEEIAEQQEAVSEAEEEVAELAGAPSRVEQLIDDLDALGNPRREFQRAQDVAARRETVAEELGKATEEVTQLDYQVAELEEKLAAYEDLDERIEAQREKRERHAEAHERYMAHIREAEKLEERQKTVAEREEELSAARVERERLIEERDSVAKDYDEEAHAELKEAYDRLRSEVATLEATISHQRGELEGLEEEIAYLTGVQAELDEARAERDELEELLSLLEYLRGVVRDAGPKVTRALVQVISAQAAQLYADIMTERRARLSWTDDYEVILKSDGRERSFQQLSGGEQMAAALAVRLALLKEVSAINLAFFDEPTANLDDRRRDNLAEQILNVKGFSQLFVISHDDTFEQDTDHVVRVVKEDGRSQIIGA